MITAVLDTNTVVSGALVPEGIPAQLLEAARAQRFVLVTSAAIIEEVVRTLSRERIRRKYHVTPTDVRRLRQLLEYDTTPTTITRAVHGAATHPEDDLILGTAVSANADYLVSGDRQLRKLRTYEGVTIVSPREFLDILAQRGNQ